MKAVTIEIIDQRVIPLLRNLEALNLIRMRDEQTDIPTEKLSDKYKGEMTKQPIDEVKARFKEFRG